MADRPDEGVFADSVNFNSFTALPAAPSAGLPMCPDAPQRDLFAILPNQHSHHCFPMKHIYLICYDVGEPKRLRKVYKTLQGAGESLQYSVFRCELSQEERQRLIERLWEILNLAEDRLLVANLGLAESRGTDCLQYWGIPREVPNSTRPIVL